MFICGSAPECIEKENAVMNKKRKIIIAGGVLLIVLTVGVLVIGVLGFILFSRQTASAEMVFPATEVGTPVGAKVAKEIGPAGGWLSSPDGRIKVIVPKNAVTENTQFSIQPITSTLTYGIGQGYRLEPAGKTFASPLQLTIHYENSDLEGTLAEALQLAYQDKKGAWHVASSGTLDKEARTVTISTTHFSDWLFLRTVAISPTDAKVLVGDTVFIKIDACVRRDWINRYNPWVYVFGDGKCWRLPTDGAKWELKGAGKLTRVDKSSGAVYTAPSVKPTENHVKVVLDIDITTRDPGSGEVSTYPKKFETLITIFDRGYTASGKAGTTVLSGDICDLEKHFTLKTNNPFVPSLEFEPDSISPNKGTFTFTTGNGLSGSCECEYTITGTDSEKTGIELTGSSTGSLQGITGSGSGGSHIDLVPLKGECKPS